MEKRKDPSRFRFVSNLVETFGLTPAVASLVAFLLALIPAAGVVWIIRSAPPRTLTFTSGRPGTSFQRVAESYQKKLAEHGITVVILPSEGSQENLRRLESPNSGVDIGFVQGGLAEGEDLSHLVSLGSVSYQALWIFYRGQTRITKLSDLAGKRLAIGAPGSGTRALALNLLKVNGVTETSATLLDVDSDAGAASFLDGKADAIFLMGESASSQTIRNFLRSPDIQLYSFTQADAYIRRFAYLNKLVIPEGSIDFGKDLPNQDTVLIAPTVELLAREGLNSAISDLLLDVAQEVHGRASLLQKRGEFPAPIEHEFRISDDAQRYYKSGKSYLYRKIANFWVASLVNRTLVAVIPILLVIIPAIRLLPVAYRWRIQLRIFRCYRRLLKVERGAESATDDVRQRELLIKLDEIETEVNRLHVPASFGEQFYVLRGHLAFVRARLSVPARR